MPAAAQIEPLLDIVKEAMQMVETTVKAYEEAEGRCAELEKQARSKKDPEIVLQRIDNLDAAEVETLVKEAAERGLLHDEPKKVAAQLLTSPAELCKLALSSIRSVAPLSHAFGHPLSKRQSRQSRKDDPDGWSESLSSPSS